MLIKHKEKIVNLDNVTHIKLNDKTLKVVFHFTENDNCSFAFESLEDFSVFVSNLKAKELS